MLLVFSVGAVNFSFAQCDTSRWKATIDAGAGGAITNILPAATIFQGGTLTASPSVSYPDPYYVNLSLKDTFCITNNFSVEVRLKNDPAEGGAVSGDTWISLAGSGITAGCLLEGLPSAQIYTAIYVGSSSMSNLPQLVMDLSSWRTIRFDFINNVLNWSYDGANFFSMNYSGSICNINKLSVGFREAGKVDYIKVYDAVNTVVYYEEFNDCNNLAWVPDCVAPDVNAGSSNTAFCENDTIKLSGSANVSVQYSWNGPNGFTSTLPNPIIPNALPLNSGWYKLTGYVNPCTPSNKDSVYLTVYPKKYTSLYPFICQGDTYYAAGNNQTNAGLYYDTLNSSTGCDSIVLTYLSVLPISASSALVSVCSNDSFFVGGNYQHLAGIYQDTLINHLGCDSIITTTLSLIIPVYNNVSMYICFGDSVFLGGAFRKLSGIYNDTTAAITGCDSIIITNLSVIAPVVTSLNISICQGESYLAGGIFQTLNGSYYDTLASVLGCDSVVITNLQVIQPVTGNRTVFICENDSFFTGGTYQSMAGIYIDSLTSAAGCDSILTTNLQLIIPLYANVDAFICQGDSMFVGGSFHTLSGFYNDTLVANSTGCDSIIITHLQLIAPQYTSVAMKICLGDSIFAGGNFQSTAGAYVDTIKSSAGCDSIATTLLEIISPVSNSISVFICNGNSYFASGNFQTTSGIYVDTLQSAGGCDSILSTNLQVIFPIYATRSVSICDGQSYFTGGASQVISGNYTDTLIASNGCDSILTTLLTVLPNPFVYLGQDTSICEGTSTLFDAGNGSNVYTWNDGSHMSSLVASEAGLYWVQITDPSGCTSDDTIEILNVFENPHDFLPADSAVCGKFDRMIVIPGFISYTWSNLYEGDTAIFIKPGDYSLQVTDVNGCIGNDEITFESVCQKALIMPNAFTPNGDGINEVLKPVLLDEINDYELKIFNRWGKLIFYSSNPNTGWTGQENGVLLPVEEYVWTARYKNGNGEEQFEKGSVALLK